MDKIKSFSNFISLDEGDKVRCKNAASLVNYGSVKNPKLGELFTVSKKEDKFYYLKNESDQELTYPYKEYEMQLFFEKV